MLEQKKLDNGAEDSISLEQLKNLQVAICGQKRKLPYGEGKVEFLASLETVKKLQRAGYCGRAIYRRLATEGAITMSYRSFITYLSRLDTHIKRGQRKQSSIKAEPSSVKPQLIRNASGSPQAPQGVVLKPVPAVNTPKGNGNVIDGRNMFSQLVGESKEFLETNTQSEDI